MPTDAGLSYVNIIFVTFLHMCSCPQTSATTWSGNSSFHALYNVCMLCFSTDYRSTNTYQLISQLYCINNPLVCDVTSTHIYILYMIRTYYTYTHIHVQVHVHVLVYVHIQCAYILCVRILQFHSQPVMVMC